MAFGFWGVICRLHPQLAFVAGEVAIARYSGICLSRPGSKKPTREQEFMSPILTSSLALSDGPWW